MSSAASSPQLLLAHISSLLLSQSLTLKSQKLFHLLKRVGRCVWRHGRWGLRSCSGRHHNLLLLLAWLNQTLSQCIVVKTGCHNAWWQVLVLSLGCDDLLFNDFALASAALSHVSVSLVALLDGHVDCLLLECGSVAVVTERVHVLFVHEEEGSDQGCVKDRCDNHAPGHIVMFAVVAMVTLSMVSLAVFTLSVVAFAALAMAALLSMFTFLTVLALVSAVKVTSTVALVN